ncbi:hypothetical protein LJC34_05755 [Oscillospiraceae bacterium OttesenSCG-928-G22]|nr:hypothetical protein [Oscillospiraceae bacterium OttesenSCG-928-G22]
MNRNKKYIIAITAVLLLLFAGCAEQHTDQPNEAEMHIEQKTFSVSPEDFTSAMAENTYFSSVSNEKDNTIQFEDASSSITVTAMLYDKKITTLVFRVQGINMTENEINGYADRLNTVAAIVLEQEIDCPPALFAEVQTISVSGATFESIFSSDDITIMMVPEN